MEHFAGQKFFWLFWLLTLLLAAGVAGADWLGLRPHRGNQTTTTNRPISAVSLTPPRAASPTPPPSPPLRSEEQALPTAVPGPLESWRTYQSEEYGFRLRHPAEFFILPTDEITGEGPWRRGLLRISSSPMPEKDEFATILTVSVSNQKSQQGWIYREIEEELNLAQLRKQLAPRGVFLNFLGNPPFGVYEVKILRTLLPDQPDVYLDLILQSHHENREADLALFRQILTTLEFTPHQP